VIKLTCALNAFIGHLLANRNRVFRQTTLSSVINDCGDIVKFCFYSLAVKCCRTVLDSDSHPQKPCFGLRKRCFYCLINISSTMSSPTTAGNCIFLQCAHVKKIKSAHKPNPITLFSVHVNTMFGFKQNPIHVNIASVT